MKYAIKYIDYASKTAPMLRIWEVDGKELNLKIAKRKKEFLRDMILKLKYNLENNLPLIEVVEKIGVFNTLELVYKLFLEEFLEHLERYISKRFNNDISVSFDTFILENISKDVKQPGNMLSKPNTIDLKDAMIDFITDGRIKELDIAFHLSQGATLNLIGYVIGPNSLIRLLTGKYFNELSKYIEVVYKRLVENRELISYSAFKNDYLASMKSHIKNEQKKLLKELVEKEYNKSLDYLIFTNEDSFYMNEDEWRIYTKSKGLSVSCNKIHFRDILSPKFKLDLKYFYRNALREVLRNGGLVSGFLSSFHSTIKAINYIYTVKGIECFGEIKNIDAQIIYQYLMNDVTDNETGKPISVTTISKVMANLRSITDFLIEKQYSNHAMPKINYFRNIKMSNLNNMGNTTEVIPEFVIDQIATHKSELSEVYQRMLIVFENTGMRLKEVIFLEEDCIIRTDDGIILKFIPYKVLNSHKKKKKSEMHSIYITETIAKVIENQIEKTKEIRVIRDKPYIFLDEINGTVRVQGKGITAAINRVIKKYDICDIDGVLWRFDSRQMRATTSAVMIQNGATETEIMQQFNHDSIFTTRKYYEKAEKLKLADLNQHFFEKEFEIKVGKENLALYTEEERRALYIDFKLAHREVEFGKCLKHKSEGPCGKRKGNSSCANCIKLCTGKKYIDKWKRLFDNQKLIIEHLESGYKKEKILEEDYSSFIEYKKEINQLKIYESVIASIEGE